MAKPQLLLLTYKWTKPELFLSIMFSLFLLPFLLIVFFSRIIFMAMEVDSAISDSRVGLVLESSDSTGSIGPYQPNEHPSDDAGGPSSRLRGIIMLKSGNWGARISIKQKPVWLGTYQRKEDAARAYDRAAIKLQRGDAFLNFPWTDFTAQEAIFQSHYSTEVILKMIKDKIYLSMFTNFILSQSSIMGYEVSDLMNEQGISYQLLFQKELTPGDVHNLKRFLIPMEYALVYFPSLSGISSGGVEDGSKVVPIQLAFYDKHRSVWTFRYSYWKCNQSCVFTKGWKEFVRAKNLRAKDVVSFYMGEYGEGIEKRKFYMIDVHHANGANDDVGRHVEQEISLRGNIGNGVAVDTEGEGIKKGLRIFGVQFG